MELKTRYATVAELLADAEYCHVDSSRTNRHDSATVVGRAYAYDGETAIVRYNIVNGTDESYVRAEQEAYFDKSDGEEYYNVRKAIAGHGWGDDRQLLPEDHHPERDTDVDLPIDVSF